MTRTCEVIDGAIIYQLIQLQIRKKQAEKDGTLTKVRINKSTIDEFSILTDSFMDNFVQRLKRLSEIQRRRSPNISDIELLLNEGIVDLVGLNESFNDCKLLQELSLKNPKRATNLSQIEFLGKKLESETPIETQPDLGWYDRITKRKLTREYIPKWMPQLPPEYTWKSTPRFTERVRDPRILRERLVVEGRLGEKALEHIVVNESPLDPINSPIYEDEPSDTSVDSEIEEVSMVNCGGNFGFEEEDDDDDEEDEFVDLANPKQQKKNKKDDRKFDIVEFANNRIKMLERKRELEERKIKKRINSATSKWGKALGSFSAVNEISDSLPYELSQFKKRKYHQLLSGLQKQEIKCSEWMKKQEEKRRVLAEERKKIYGATEIQVGMPMLNNSSEHQIIPQLDEQQLEVVNVDEELEFDMDFSDMEEIETFTEKIPDMTQETN